MVLKGAEVVDNNIISMAAIYCDCETELKTSILKEKVTSVQKCTSLIKMSFQWTPEHSTQSGNCQVVLVERCNALNRWKQQECRSVARKWRLKPTQTFNFNVSCKYWKNQTWNGNRSVQPIATSENNGKARLTLLIQATMFSKLNKIHELACFFFFLQLCFALSWKEKKMFFFLRNSFLFLFLFWGV